MYGHTSPDGDTGPSQKTRDLRGHKQTVPNLGQQRAVKGDPEVGDAEKGWRQCSCILISLSLPPSPHLSFTHTHINEK